MEYTKYEKARIIGARALQLAMGAPLLIKRPKDIFNTVDIAELELNKGVRLPFCYSDASVSKKAYGFALGA